MVAATGLRGGRLLSASPDTAVVVRAVEADLVDRALVVERDGEAWSVRSLGAADGRRVRPGQVVEVGGNRVQIVEGVAGAGHEILRVPWSVFGARRGGHRRIDFGADPTGAGDRVRDRVVLPAHAGGLAWFRLEADGTGRAFGPDDRSALLVVEREGLTVRADTTHEPAAGAQIPVDGPFDVEADGVHLRVAWRSVARASVLEGRDGRVVGYGEAQDGVDFVVTSLGDRGLGRPQLALLDAAGEPLDRVVLADATATLIHNPRARLAGLTGHVLPDVMRDERLEAAVREGLRDGWIELSDRGSRVVVPSEDDAPRRDLGWGLAREVVALVDAYDASVSPVALRLLDGVRASASTSAGAGLRFDAGLQAWRPSGEPTGPTSFELSVSAAEVQLASALPGRWRPAGSTRWRALPPPRSGGWIPWRLDAGDAATIEVRLEPPNARAGADRFAASVAGAPDGTLLQAEDVRVGRRAYDRWQEPGFDAAARSLWRRLPGDRWSAESARVEPTIRGGVRYLRVPLTASEAGWLALDLAVPGRVLSASWNGAELADPNLPTDPSGGATRLSLATRVGPNLLALRVELPASRPPAAAGAVRFETNPQGQHIALERSVGERRRRDAVRRERRRLKAAARFGAPQLVVERGVPGLPAGTRWRLSASSSVPGTSALVLADGPGAVRRNDFGALQLGPSGLAWHNGERLALAAVRPLREDPNGLAVAGQRVGVGARQTLATSGEAVEGPTFQLRALSPAEGVVRGELVVVHGGAVASLAVDGVPRWHRDPAEGDLEGLHLVLHADGGDVRVAVDRPASLWTHDGEQIPLREALIDAADAPDALTPWPPGARLVIAGTSLRLRRPGRSEGLEVPSWADDPDTTLDPDLQDAARWALRSQLTDPGEDSELLAGALLVMNARTGDILACASEERPHGDARSRLSRPCWQDGGFHPGSTFKIATAAAALSSHDPAVRRMLDGSPPQGLVGDGPRATLRGAKLPVAGGKTRVLRSRLRNYRGRPMAVDATLEDALRGSLNTWFGYVGLLLHRPLREGWGTAGIATEAGRAEAWPLARVAAAAGFGRRIDLGGGEVGTGGAWPTAAAPSDATVAARSVGQDAVTASPLGVAGLLSVAALDGAAPTPRIRTTRAVARRSVLPPNAAARLRSALHGVVRRGTARKAFADNPYRTRILGKTGSAQRFDREGLSRTDAWFGAAILPPDGVDADPIVAAVVLPGGGLGGGRAAEVVDQFSRDLVRARGWSLASPDAE